MLKTISILFIFIIILVVAPLTFGLLLHKSRPRVSFVMYCITAGILLVQTGFWLDDVTGWQAHRHFKRIQAFLERPFNGFDKDLVFQGYAIIALSNTADGLVNYGLTHPDQYDTVTQLLQRIITIATDSRTPLSIPLENISASGENGLYLSHLNIILGAYHRFSGDAQYFSINQKISQYLAETTVNDSQKHVHSYADQPQKWPADQAATLYSLYLFDRNNQMNLSEQPIREWLAYMNTAGTEPTLQLHYSEVTKTIDYWKHPRGCALSWTVKYMAKFAPTEARELWTIYKRRFKQSYLIAAGFREYPKGIQWEPDSDSGPIILGNGAAATAFGMAASKAMDDLYTYYQIQNSAHLTDLVIHLVTLVDPDSTLALVSQDMVATSIRFSSETYREWY